MTTSFRYRSDKIAESEKTRRRFGILKLNEL